jgi:hypothetical protein
MDAHARLGVDLTLAVQRMGSASGITVVNALYAAAYELARRTGQTPRTVFECCFTDAPTDEEWRATLLPLLLDSESEAA